VIDLVIYDQHFPWSPSYNASHAVGGWECHMVQIAEWLAGRGLSVWALNPSANNIRIDGDNFRAPVTYAEHGTDLRCRALITGRHSDIPDSIAATRIFTSAGDDPRHGTERYDHLLGHSTIVCLSEWQAMLYRSMGHETAVIPSAIDDAVYDLRGEHHPGRFVCCNAWNKGTIRTLAQWALLKSKYPGWKAELRVGSPYSHPGDAKERCEQAGAHWIGQLAPKQVIGELASAEAVFRVNDHAPETFGVSDAIAEAVGTRVHCLRTGEIGASREALVSPYLTADPAEFERGVLFPALPYPPPNDWRASRVLPKWIDVLGLGGA
jgi:hypothetical protein